MRTSSAAMTARRVGSEGEAVLRGVRIWISAIGSWWGSGRVESIKMLVGNRAEGEKIWERTRSSLGVRAGGEEVVVVMLLKL